MVLVVGRVSTCVSILSLARYLVSFSRNCFSPPPPSSSSFFFLLLFLPFHCFLFEDKAEKPVFHKNASKVVCSCVEWESDISHLTWFFFSKKVWEYVSAKSLFCSIYLQRLQINKKSCVGMLRYQHNLNKTWHWVRRSVFVFLVKWRWLLLQSPAAFHAS